VNPEEDGLLNGLLVAPSFCGAISLSMTKVIEMGFGALISIGTPSVTMSTPHRRNVAFTVSVMHSSAALGATATIH